MAESASEFRHLGGGRKGLFLLLRYVFIAAASYLVLLHDQQVDPSHAFMIAVALASNVALSLVSPGLVFSWYVEAPVLIADTLWVSWALHSTGAAGQEFFLLYFFVLSLAALGESLALVLLGSTALSLVNVYLTGWHPNNLIQIVFFYTVALFYGYVIKEIKGERQRADRGVLWVRELEAKVEERTRELSRLYEVLQREARISTAMAQVGRELIEVMDASLVVHRLCRLTPELLQCQASATLLMATETDAVVPVGYFGGEAAMFSLDADGIPATLGDDLLEALRADDVVEARHADPDDRFGSRLLHQRHGVVTTLYMALRRGETLIGCHTASRTGGDGGFSSEQKRIARGIANLASLALENSRLTASLEKANRLKSEFVATMSHELRTPLNVMLGLTDLLRDGEYGAVTDEQRSVCDRIEQSGWTLLELINSTLDLSRLEQGRLDVDMRATDVRGLFGQLRREMEPLVQRKPRVRVVWNTPIELPELCTDGSKLKVVLKNLITNALKFTDEGSVNVTASDRGDHLEVEVADTGEGIPRDQLTAIFEPFRQLDGSLTRRHEGVGLGLHIVRRYVDLLGGQVEVESEPGAGSLFRVRIPTAYERLSRAS